MNGIQTSSILKHHREEGEKGCTILDNRTCATFSSPPDFCAPSTRAISRRKTSPSRGTRRHSRVLLPAVESGLSADRWDRKSDRGEIAGKNYQARETLVRARHTRSNRWNSSREGKGKKRKKNGNVISHDEVEMDSKTRRVRFEMLD